ncbi:DUF1194 domain-containing protein [Lichenifustis flavocetrariae]|uniref:DUF1194 domain-containing protein n=1 Tax=Lichenifustis flavocetrariae TaxID=2949735 RepID=A0AA41Z047_9HYPH|nr:DUF1194 domain-containing protein [Lichenifustis flavocetrariae]MCW6510417.1 DUF1194 domain-containing protein [Lichenifustis flavocetrariae]
MWVLRPLIPFCAILVGPATARPADRVDVALVLAADVSRSITTEKFDLQREGYAAAIRDPQVLNAVASGPNHRIAVALVEWSGAGSQAVVVDWTLIESARDAEVFAGRTLAAPRAFANRTALGAALTFARTVLAQCPYDGDRKVIDVSGDGTNNDGMPAGDARDAALAAGVSTINGLVILSSDTGSSYLKDHENPPGGLQSYYRQNVAGGTGSFVLVAKSFESFGRSLVAKLVQEIS